MSHRHPRHVYSPPILKGSRYEDNLRAVALCLCIERRPRIFRNLHFLVRMEGGGICSDPKLLFVHLNKE
jgi:hypothetical protein